MRPEGDARSVLGDSTQLSRAPFAMRATCNGGNRQEHPPLQLVHLLALLRVQRPPLQRVHLLALLRVQLPPLLRVQLA